LLRRNAQEKIQAEMQVNANNRKKIVEERCGKPKELTGLSDGSDKISNFHAY
jgi:hypothetical protein